MNADALGIDELFIEAIMTEVPCVLVEGIDDIEIYSQLSEQLEVKPEVYAIETVKGFTVGCEQVIKAINRLDELPPCEHAIVDHMLGIIDKDVREFRNQLPQSEAILVLKYYSIESHFISSTVIEQLLAPVLKPVQR
jgi:hypothetical protein